MTSDGMIVTKVPLMTSDGIIATKVPLMTFGVIVTKVPKSRTYPTTSTRTSLMRLAVPLRRGGPVSNGESIPTSCQKMPKNTHKPITQYLMNSVLNVLPSMEQRESLLLASSSSDPLNQPIQETKMVPLMAMLNNTKQADKEIKALSKRVG